MEKFDVIIIGGGPGGYETALYAKENGLSTLLIEKDKLGGTCLNRGCIPTKTYNAIAKVINEMKKVNGTFVNVNYDFDFSKAKEKKDNVVSELQNGIKFLLEKNGVGIKNGFGYLVDNNHVKVDDELFEGSNIIIATGSSNLTGIIPGEEYAIDSTDLLDIDSVPNSLAIIGGGVVGVEMATVFNTFGTKVTIFEGMNSILPNIDKEISRRLQSFLTRSGITVYTNAKVLSINNNGLSFDNKGNTTEAQFDKVLLSIGRRANINNIGLENCNIEVSRKGIVTNEYFETNVKGIYAIGDCNGKVMLAHYASFSGKVVIDHILGKDINNYLVPSAIFTFPEVATVGKTEDELKESGIEYSVKKVMYRANGKALAMGEVDGFIKTLVLDDKIVGCHIIGYDASTLIHEAVLLINSNTSVNEAKKYIYAHPTLSELFKDSLELF